MSAIDYARFIQVFEPGSRALGPLGATMAGGAHRQSRLWPRHLRMRRTEQGLLLTHTGRLTRPRSRSGSFVVKFPNGVTAVAIFAGDPAQGAIADLRRRLETAIASL